MSTKMKHSDSDSNNPIPYKYIDADNRVYKDPYLNNKNEESSEDLISKKSQKSKSKKRRKSKKINKEKLSEEEIYELMEEKNADIIELNKKTEKLKLKLTSLVKKINAKITENAEILYRKDPSPTEMQWLTEQYDSKKRALQIEHKINGWIVEPKQVEEAIEGLVWILENPEYNVMCQNARNYVKCNCSFERVLDIHKPLLNYTSLSIIVIHSFRHPIGTTNTPSSGRLYA